MLIDAFTEDWIDILIRRASQLPASRKMYLLLDGAFVPGLHRRLPKESKALLFDALPGCSEEAEDVSPFLTAFVPDDRFLKRFLGRCNRWPMVSAIETSETLEQLADRLGGWCLVESDGQRFNFRFPDTRRLSAILKALSPVQCAQITGPAVCWSYIDRTGCWCDLVLPGCDTDIAVQAELDQHQFAFLVMDSAADEILVMLANRGHKVFEHPSRSHALVTSALHAVHTTQLLDSALLDWCEWLWRQRRLHDVSDMRSVFQAWFDEYLRGD
ncbi:DUF4123 domain-containing protein [Massilia sp. 2TAF26]|uniref:DUF4123 domain-containing protein n=1 Tax=Massilia sp. 2TAF26 TaxID=3233012 RepID=UPI003F978B3C